MEKSVTENLANAGSAVKNSAKHVGNKIAESVDRAADFFKEKTGMADEAHDLGVAGIQDHMDVIASCGKKVGVVDAVEGEAIKLTRNDSPDHQHHFIPLDWVRRVDNQVHLNKNSMQTEQGWKATSQDCHCGS